MPTPEPPTEPAPPRDAATVVVVRESRGLLELFCVQRSARSGFMAGAVVFPGGKVDAADGASSWTERITAVPPRAAELARSTSLARSCCIAALRETLEEGAILPVAGDALDPAAVIGLRDACQRSGRLEPELAARRLRLDIARLSPLGRWITPSAEPKRFDTRFYLLPCPPGQDGTHDRHETTRSFWETPSEILRRWELGEIFLAPPTSHTIELFLKARSVADALRIAAAQPLHPVAPEFVQHEGGILLTLPGDPLHPKEPSAPARDDQPTRFVLENGRFVPQRTR